MPSYFVFNLQKELDPEGMEKRKVNDKRKKTKIEFDYIGPLCMTMVLHDLI